MESDELTVHIVSSVTGSGMDPSVEISAAYYDAEEAERHAAAIEAQVDVIEVRRKAPATVMQWQAQFDNAGRVFACARVGCWFADTPAGKRQMENPVTTSYLPLRCYVTADTREQAVLIATEQWKQHKTEANR